MKAFYFSVSNPVPDANCLLTFDNLPIVILQKIWSELLTTTRLVENPASRSGGGVARLGLQPQILRLKRAIFSQSLELLYQLNSFGFTTPADLQNFEIHEDVFHKDMSNLSSEFLGDGA